MDTFFLRSSLRAHSALLCDSSRFSNSGALACLPFRWIFFLSDNGLLSESSSSAVPSFDFSLSSIALFRLAPAFETDPFAGSSCDPTPPRMDFILSAYSMKGRGEKKTEPKPQPLTFCSRNTLNQGKNSCLVRGQEIIPPRQFLYLHSG